MAPGATWATGFLCLIKARYRHFPSFPAPQGLPLSAPPAAATGRSCLTPPPVDSVSTFSSTPADWTPVLDFPGNSQGLAQLFNIQHDRMGSWGVAFECENKAS